MRLPPDPVIHDDPNRAAIVMARFHEVDADMHEHWAMDFDLSTTSGELIELAATLTDMLGQPVFHKHGQGGAFIGELLSGAQHTTERGYRAYDFVVAVCGFGRLAMVGRVNPDNPTDEQLKSIHALLEESGFFPVGVAETLLPYTGVNQRIVDRNLLWRDRLFGYV